MSKFNWQFIGFGSGTGATIQLVKDNFDVSTYAVDYSDTLMGLPNQKVDIVDLNHCKLLYEDNFFNTTRLPLNEMMDGNKKTI